MWAVVSEPDRPVTPGNPGRSGTPPSKRGAILHIATRYLRGGSERRISDAMGALEDFEHDLVVGPESDVPLARSQLPVNDLIIEPRLVRSPHPYADGVTLIRLTRLIKDRRPLLVFTHQSKAGALGRMAARSAGVPAVHSLSMASFGPGYSRIQSMVFKWLEVRLGSSTAAYTTVGQELARRYLEAGIPADKFHLIRSGVPIPEEDRPRRDLKAAMAQLLGAPPDRPWLIHVGSLEARKNVMSLPQLLTAVKAASNGTPPYLIVAGDGPQKPELEEHLSSRGLSKDATVAGYISDIAPLIRASDILVLLSQVEGLPQVLVQASAVGTRFVAFEVEGVKEMLELGADGVAVRDRDLGLMAEAIAARIGTPHPTKTADLTSWAPEEIRRSYQQLIDSLIATSASVD